MKKRRNTLLSIQKEIEKCKLMFGFVLYYFIKKFL